MSQPKLPSNGHNFSWEELEMALTKKEIIHQLIFVTFFQCSAKVSGHKFTKFEKQIDEINFLLIVSSSQEEATMCSNIQMNRKWWCTDLFCSMPGVIVDTKTLCMIYEWLLLMYPYEIQYSRYPQYKSSILIPFPLRKTGSEKAKRTGWNNICILYWSDSLVMLVRRLLEEDK